MKNLFPSLAILCCFLIQNLQAQGYLMLAGGGAEDYNEWSDTPYQWAVNQSQNKRVAIVSFNTETQFLPTYFVSLGAASAKNFKIDNTTIANAQTTYDSLMAHDVIFIKGGDQSNYYSTYHNTKTQDAIEDKFANGGVLAGTSAGAMILGEVIFSASGGSFGSSDVTDSLDHPNITLEEDFVGLQKGVLFDTHFAERARELRLKAMLNNWRKETGDSILGVGIDDKTAICVDSNGVAIVYGTGTAHLLQMDKNQSFSVGSHWWETSQLKHGQTFEMPSGRVLNGNGSFGQTDSCSFPYTDFQYGCYFSTATNASVLDTHLMTIDSIQSMNGKNAIIFADSLSSFNSYLLSRLASLSNSNATLILVGTLLKNDPVLKSDIDKADLIVFAGNNFKVLRSFLAGISASSIMSDTNGPSHDYVFIGRDVRFAGKFLYDNDSLANSSHYGDIRASKGLGLFSNAIFSEEWSAADAGLNENRQTALRWLQGQKSIRLAVAMSDDVLMKYEGFGYILPPNSYPLFLRNGSNI